MLLLRCHVAVLHRQYQPACLCHFVAGGGGGSGQRREGELDGIDMDFDDTQVEVQLEGVTHSSCARPNVAHQVILLMQVRLGTKSTAM